jgi:hypothetical protein
VNRIGFTGTREGLTHSQRATLAQLLAKLRDRGMTEFHHGMCVGADQEAHSLIRSHMADVRIHGHPASRVPDHLRAMVDVDERRSAFPPLIRNQHIVSATELLVACPNGPETVRSGTWSTVRYAATIGRPVVIVYPSGDLSKPQGALIHGSS